MISKEYIVNRDDIHVGKVIKTHMVYGTCDLRDAISKNECYFQRSMLFVPTADNLANDLLYNSPNYPILNSNYSNTVGATIVVTEPFNLSDILEYFGYDEKLTYKDILNIKKEILTKKFCRENSKLFGLSFDEHGYKEVPNAMFSFDYYKNILENSDSSTSKSLSGLIITSRGSDYYKPGRNEVLVKRLKKRVF